jgi:cation transport regulator ChaB
LLRIKLGIYKDESNRRQKESSEEVRHNVLLATTIWERTNEGSKLA